MQIIFENEILPVEKEWNSEMDYIRFDGELPIENGLRRAQVKIGAATLHGKIRRWSLWNNWTLPFDVQDEFSTIGGSVTMLCHGAGRRSRTLADIVLKVVFVNASGELQTLEDKQLIR